MCQRPRMYVEANPALSYKYKKKKGNMLRTVSPILEHAAGLYRQNIQRALQLSDGFGEFGMFADPGAQRSQEFMCA